MEDLRLTCKRNWVDIINLLRFNQRSLIQEINIASLVFHGSGAGQHQASGRQYPQRTYQFQESLGESTVTGRQVYSKYAAAGLAWHPLHPDHSMAKGNEAGRTSRGGSGGAQTIETSGMSHMKGLSSTFGGKYILLG